MGSLPEFRSLEVTDEVVRRRPLTEYKMESELEKCERRR